MWRATAFPQQPAALEVPYLMLALSAYHSLRPWPRVAEFPLPFLYAYSTTCPAIRLLRRADIHAGQRCQSAQGKLASNHAPSWPHAEALSSHMHGLGR